MIHTMCPEGHPLERDRSRGHTELGFEGEGERRRVRTIHLVECLVCHRCMAVFWAKKDIVFDDAGSLVEGS